MWKLDNIEFSDYGVVVSSITGLFDSPKIINEAQDWLDEDGVDYWHEISNQKYADNKITLSCSIAAANYSEFLTRLKSFYDALQSADLRELTTPYTSGVIECYLDGGIKMNRLDRQSRFIESKQVGIFIFSLVKQGDPDAFHLDIKRWTGTETLTVATVFTRDLRVNKTLQGEIYASCSFESNVKLDLKYFDYFRLNSNGVNEDTFHLGGDPELKKISSNKYQYNCRFEHQSVWLSGSQFLDDLGQADFYDHVNMEEIVDMIVTSHNRSWWNNFQKGTVVSTERRLHKFSGEDCMSVLKRIAEEYDLEFEFEFVAVSRYNINVKEQVANTKAVTLEYGKGNGLYELSRGQIDKTELCTILYAFGAAKNLKPDYRNGMTRLSFDNNPLKNNEGLHDGAGPHEKTVFFDDIFPQRTSKVTAYEQVLTEDLTPSQKEVWPDGLYKVTDSTLEFDLNDCFLNGLTAKIKMKSGDLAGHDFEISKYDHTFKTIYIIPFKDERGDIFPNELLLIKADDNYTLVDISQPASYIAVAEAELEAAATAYLANSSIPKFPYRAIVDPAFMALNPGGFEVGDRFDIVDTDYGIDDEFRISQLTYDVYQGRYDFMLSDTVRLNRRQILELRMQAVERAMQSARKDSAESSRNNVEDSGELRRRLLDPADDKFAADRIVRNESIDPRMLAYDSGNIQWSFQGVWFSDKDGDGVSIAWTEGTFVIHNDKAQTLDRYGIDKRRILDVEYDPTRTWNIAAGDWEVPAADYDVYWVYVKLTMAAGSTVAEIEFYKEHKEPKLLPGYLRYKIGEIQRELELEV